MVELVTKENKRISQILVRWTFASLLLALGAISGGQAAFAQNSPVSDTWTVDCNQGEKCVLYYITNGFQFFIGEELEGERMLAEIRVGPSTQGTPASIRLNTGWIAGLQVTECADEINCRLIVDLTTNGSLVNEFKRGSDGMMAYVVEDGAAIVMVPFSLAGFTAAYNQLTGG